jgi:UDP-glucose 4-epimerase
LCAGGASITLNVADGGSNSVREVIEAMNRVTGRNLPVCSAARLPGDLGTLVARADKVKAMIGWQNNNDVGSTRPA